MALAQYAWKITKELLVEGDDIFEGKEVGRAGPRDASDDLLARIDKGEGARWRMLDDDGNAYVEGRIIYADDASDDSGPGSEDDFAPLNDYGMGGLGCTAIQYWEPGAGGGWKTL